MEPDGESSVSLLLEELVRAAIPDLDGAGAVLACGDDALEVTVLERVVLDVYGEMPLALAQRDAFWDGPARESAVPLKPEVVMEAAGVVSLDHEARLALPWVLAAERLGRLPSAALALVLVEAHLWIVSRDATRSLPTRCMLGFFPAQTLVRCRG